jgi:hypothetical protein
LHRDAEALVALLIIVAFQGLSGQKGLALCVATNWGAGKISPHPKALRRVWPQQC